MEAGKASSMHLQEREAWFIRQMEKLWAEAAMLKAEKAAMLKVQLWTIRHQEALHGIQKARNLPKWLLQPKETGVLNGTLKIRHYKTGEILKGLTKNMKQIMVESGQPEYSKHLSLRAPLVEKNAQEREQEAHSVPNISTLASFSVSPARRWQVFPTRSRILLLCLCLQMPVVAAELVQIQGPHEPVVALLGDEAELPYFVSLLQNVEHMQLGPTGSQVVLLYKDGRDQPGEVMVEYSKRTTLIRDAIYKVLGSDPHFHVNVTESRETRVECKSEGWFPQPKVQWIHYKGEKIPPLSESQTQDKDGLFLITASLLLRDPSDKNLRSSTWNPAPNQKRKKQLAIADSTVICSTAGKETRLNTMSRNEHTYKSSSVSPAHGPRVALLQSSKKNLVSPTYYGSIFLFHLCLQMCMAAAGAFQIQGPHEPVVAMLGDEADLPCFLLPPQSAKYMQISWYRSLSSEVVSLYRDGSDHPEQVIGEYSGRTTLVKDAIYKGIVVLRILDVQSSDNGLYRCRFRQGFFYNDTLIELKVAVLGSTPHFHVNVTESKKTLVECKSEGWFPQPKVQWINSKGEEIPPTSESQTQDKDGLFQVTTSLLLSDPSEKNLRCSIWNPVLNQRKEEQLFVAVAEFSSGLLLKAFAASTALLMLGLISTGLCLFYQRRHARKAMIYNAPGKEIKLRSWSKNEDTCKCEMLPDRLTTLDSPGI